MNQIRNKSGKFVSGHIVLSEWGFQKGNKANSGNHSNKGKRMSPKTEFQQGNIPWNKGKHHSLEQREKMKKNHKGMTGKHHSLITRNKISQSHFGKEMTMEQKRKMSESKVKFMLNHPDRMILRSNGGKRIVNGKEQYFRSTWEANTARLLTFQNREWEFEKKTFWFEGIKRGCRSYTPDFYLPKENIFIEVKGYMDQKSQTKLNRMAKYYPEIKIEIWDADFFRSIKKQGINKLIPDWE